MASRRNIETACLRCFCRAPRATSRELSRSNETPVSRITNLRSTTMASKHELQVQQKRELEKKEETTVPARAFIPTADIYETTDALKVVLEMPGVEKNNVNVRVEDGVLTVEGRLDF